LCWAGRMTLGAGKRNTLSFVLLEHLLACQILGWLVSKTDPTPVSRSCGLAGAGRWAVADILRGKERWLPGGIRAGPPASQGSLCEGGTLNCSLRLRIRLVLGRVGRARLELNESAQGKGGWACSGSRSFSGSGRGRGPGSVQAGPYGAALASSRRPLSRLSHSGAVGEKAGLLSRRANRRLFSFFWPLLCTRTLP